MRGQAEVCDSHHCSIKIESQNGSFRDLQLMENTLLVDSKTLLGLTELVVWLVARLATVATTAKELRRTIAMRL